MKKEAGRLKGRQLLWTVYGYHKVDSKSAVLFKIVDLVKTKVHGDRLAEFLVTWDNVMILIDEYCRRRFEGFHFRTTDGEVCEDG